MQATGDRPPSRSVIDDSTDRTCRARCTVPCNARHKRPFCRCTLNRDRNSPLSAALSTGKRRRSLTDVASFFRRRRRRMFLHDGTVRQRRPARARARRQRLLAVATAASSGEWRNRGSGYRLRIACRCKREASVEARAMQMRRRLVLADGVRTGKGAGREWPPSQTPPAVVVGCLVGRWAVRNAERSAPYSEYTCPARSCVFRPRNECSKGETQTTDVATRPRCARRWRRRGSRRSGDGPVTVVTRW